MHTPLPKHTDFGTLLARWQDVAKRFRERSREGRRKRKESRDRKKGGKGGKGRLSGHVAIMGGEAEERKVRI